MIRTYRLPLLALLGACVAIAAVVNSNQRGVTAPPVIQPAQAPFPVYLAGAGIVEASTGNITIGAPVAGVIAEIYVNVGDQVNVGGPLFKIDDRDIQAQLLTASAKVQEVAANLEKPKHRLQFASSLKHQDKGAVSANELSDLRDDVAAGESTLTLAKAQVEQIRIEIERRTIRAPVAGKILQIKARPGEYTPGGDIQGIPLMLLGDDTTLNVRVDIDEYDAWRFQPTAKAMAFVRGNSAIGTMLRFEYREPYVVPKTSLTGQSTERTDTRVLQLIYRVERDPRLNVSIGQQMDVFIQASSIGLDHSKGVP